MSEPSQQEIEDQMQDSPGEPLSEDELTGILERSRAEIANSLRHIRRELANLDGKQAATRAHEWAQENPLLATGIALGAGLLLGAAIAPLFSSEPPPTFRQRARRRIGNIADKTSSYVGDLSSGLELAVDDIKRRADEVGERIAHRASDLTTDVVRQATDLAQAVVESGSAAKAGLSDRMSGAAESLPVDETSQLVNKLGTTIRTAIIAAAMKKLSDAIKRLKRA